MLESQYFMQTLINFLNYNLLSDNGDFETFLLRWLVFCTFLWFYIFFLFPLCFNNDFNLSFQKIMVAQTYLIRKEDLSKVNTCHLFVKLTWIPSSFYLQRSYCLENNQRLFMVSEAYFHYWYISLHNQNQSMLYL